MQWTKATGHARLVIEPSIFEISLNGHGGHFNNHRSLPMYTPVEDLTAVGVYCRLPKGEFDVWDTLKDIAQCLEVLGYELNTFGHKDKVHLSIISTTSDPPIEKYLIRTSLSIGATDEYACGFSYLLPLSDTDAHRFLTSSFGKSEVTGYSISSWCFAPSFRHRQTGGALSCVLQRLFESNASDYYLGGDASGFLSGWKVCLGTDFVPEYMTAENLPKAIMLYDTMKQLTSSLGLAECLGTYIGPGYPETKVAWQDPYDWMGFTLFRFGPAIPNRLHIPLEERRLPTVDEMADDRDGFFEEVPIWLRDTEPACPPSKN